MVVNQPSVKPKFSIGSVNNSYKPTNRNITKYGQIPKEDVIRKIEKEEN